MDSFVVKSRVNGLTYYKERYNKEGNPEFGAAFTITNEIVYWHISKNGYATCFPTIKEAQDLETLLNTLPNLFPKNEILECEDTSIHLSKIAHDYDVILNLFAILPKNFYILPFSIIGKRARID